MKRFIKTTALAITAVIATVTLSSCTHLEELKETTGVYTDSTHEEVIFRNERYKRIVPEDDYQLIYKYNSYDYYYPTSGYLRDADVPILLSEQFGKRIGFLESKDNKKENPVLIMAYPDSYYMLYDYGDSLRDNDYDDTTSFYVKEDKYDDYKKALLEGDLGHYYTLTKVSMTDATGFKYTDTVETLIPEKYTDIINRTLKNDDILKDVYNDMFTNTLTLTCCDENMLIQSDYTVEISKYNGEYYIQKYDRYDDSPYNIRLHKVTESDKAEISQMFSEYYLDDYDTDYNY